MNKDKICKNCEYYKCVRSIKNGFLGASVDCRYSKENKCTAYKDQVIASPDCHCNCNRFKLWYALEMEKQREKDQRNQNREQTRIRKEENGRPRYESTDSYEFAPMHVSTSKREVLHELDTSILESDHVEHKAKEAKKTRMVGIVAIVVGGIAALFNGIFLMFLNGAINTANEVDATGLAKEVSEIQKASTAFYVFLILSLTLVIIGIVAVIKGKKK